MSRRTATALALATALGLGATGAAAADRQNGPLETNGASAEEPPRPRHVRLALGPAAASFMTNPRVRALLEVELEGALAIAEDPVGPLDEPAVRVFIDQPEAASVLVQVQTPGRALTRRRIDVTGLTWDVAARFTAIATAEIVRDHLAPQRVRRPRAPKPSADELAAADRRRQRLRVAAGVRGEVGAGGAQLGPSFGIGHETHVVDVRLGASVRAGEVADVADVELAALHRVALAPGVDLELGAGIALGSAVLSGPAGRSRDGLGRAAGHLGLGARIAPETWVSLALSPGVVAMGPSDPAGGEGSPLEGAVLGLSLALARDVPLEPRRR